MGEEVTGLDLRHGIGGRPLAISARVLIFGAQRTAWNSIYYEKESIQRHLELLRAQVMLTEILGRKSQYLGLCAQ